MAALHALGLGGDEERVYRTLLDTDGDACADDLALTLRLAPPAVRRALARLETEGLVVRSGRTPARWAPAEPEPAFEALLALRAEELDAARRAAHELERAFRRRNANGSDVVTVVVGRQAIGAQVDRFGQIARHEMLTLVKPPFVRSPVEPQCPALDRGVPVRTIYDPAVLDTPGAAESLARVAAAGEHARITGVPLKLLVADHALGLLPLHLDGANDTDRAMLVRSSALLDALVMLFESLWAAADVAPWALGHSSPTSRGVSDVDARLLALLAAGLKDEAIARQSGLGLRTVRRRIGDLMDRLGAHTRFQAGVRATERGWISRD